MLTHLSIQNFTLVDKLDLELHEGMTALTGETGAGKSIMLDALGLALGDRGDGEKVREGSAKAEITATFDVSKTPDAKAWLKELDIDSDNECIFRRVITSEGRSRGYINGQPATMSQLRELGDMLIDIHSQHEHQSLLRKDTHRLLLDAYGGHIALAEQTQEAFGRWKALRAKLDQLLQASEEIANRQQLLQFQVEELDLIDLKSGELKELEQQQKQLANAESHLLTCQQVMELCSGDEQGLETQIHHALTQLNKIDIDHAAIKEAVELLTSAEIQIQEASHAVSHFVDATGVDPAKLEEIEQRLSDIYQCARKHRVHPTELIELHEKLQEELDNLASIEKLAELETQEIQLRDTFFALAQDLTKAREQSSAKLSKAVNAQLKKLSMANARFAVTLHDQHEQPSSHGLESVEFLISTNPGSEPKSLAKIASGGELSRISLAIVVVAAKTSRIPTLVFDEVDVGIGGATADVVGALLRTLGKRGQVICVTHLGQVAAKAHHHLQVEKQLGKKQVSSRLRILEGEEKILEIARMIGGELTDQSLAHAKEMLERSEVLN